MFVLGNHVIYSFIVHCGALAVLVEGLGTLFLSERVPITWKQASTVRRYRESCVKTFLKNC